MSIVCPSILAATDEDYAVQMHRVAEFAERIQIDLMDGEFASSTSVSLDSIWWPKVISADVHLMYQRPMDHLKELIKLRPHMVIVHAEAHVHHMHFAAELHKENILAGLAILPETPIENVEQIMHSFDHLMIFSGNLGHFGGEADLALLDKVKQARSHHEDLEIGWDGGVNDHNIKQLVDGGVDILNVGGFIHGSDHPGDSYDKLVALAENVENKNDDSRT